ncbi:diguanylate cyclase, partial [Vibrio sinaloensis]|uniref:GGDEF domain-containing protein n=1 Tax=Photobacterium sp. (strain ATCC 43367) TaxID=379097 RepID=UPI002F420BBA
VIVRWGGEEFLLAVSDGADYCERAQSLIAAVNKKPIVVGDHKLEVTISIGASEPYTLEGLRVSKRAFSIADECLYQAKERSSSAGAVKSFYSQLAMEPITANVPKV